MKILHVADLHANDRWFEWLVSVSSQFDLVCIAGDLLDLNSHRAVGNQVDTVIDHLRGIRSGLVAICSGNHDSLPGDAARLHQARWLKEICSPNILVDGDRLEREGVSFECVGWNASLPKAKPNSVWLFHAPPDGINTAIARGGVGFGDVNLADICRSGRGPALVLSGHVHDPVSWHARTGATWSLNPGFATGAECPNHIVIDLGRGIAIRNGLAGEGDVLRLRKSMHC